MDMSDVARKNSPRAHFVTFVTVQLQVRQTRVEDLRRVSVALKQQARYSKLHTYRQFCVIICRRCGETLPWD